MVKHLSTVWETRVRSLGQEDPLEKEMAIHSSTIAWKIPWTEDLVGYSPWVHREVDTTERLQQLHFGLCRGETVLAASTEKNPFTILLLSFILRPTILRKKPTKAPGGV